MTLFKNRCQWTQWSVNMHISFSKMKGTTKIYVCEVVWFSLFFSFYYYLFCFSLKVIIINSRRLIIFLEVFRLLAHVLYMTLWLFTVHLQSFKLQSNVLDPLSNAATLSQNKWYSLLHFLFRFVYSCN